MAEGNNTHSEGDKKRIQSGISICSNGHKVAILKVCTAGGDGDEHKGKHGDAGVILDKKVLILYV